MMSNATLSPAWKVGPAKLALNSLGGTMPAAVPGNLATVELEPGVTPVMTLITIRLNEIVVGGAGARLPGWKSAALAGSTARLVCGLSVKQSLLVSVRDLIRGSSPSSSCGSAVRITSYPVGPREVWISGRPGPHSLMLEGKGSEE